MSAPVSLDFFARIRNDTGTGVVQLEGDDSTLRFKSEGRYHSYNAVFHVNRDVDSNNKIRTKFLLSLGEALDIKLPGWEKGCHRVSAEFLRQLDDILGNGVLKSKDFAIKDGEVVSGRPLTERRITAIIKRVEEITNRKFGDGKTLDALISEDYEARIPIRQKLNAGYASKFSGPNGDSLLKNELEIAFKELGAYPPEDLSPLLKDRDEDRDKGREKDGRNVMDIRDEIKIGWSQALENIHRSLTQRNVKKSVDALFKGVEFWNSAISAFNAAIDAAPKKNVADMPKLQKISVEKLIEQLNAQHAISEGSPEFKPDPVVIEPSRLKSADKTLDSFISFAKSAAGIPVNKTMLKSLATVFTPSYLVPGQLAVIPVGNGMVASMGNGDENKQAVPTLCNVYAGLNRIVNPKDDTVFNAENESVRHVGDEILKEVAKSIEDMFGNVRGMGFNDNEKARIKDSLKNLFANIDKGTVGTDEALIDRLCEEFDALNLRGVSSESDDLPAVEGIKLPKEHAEFALKNALGEISKKLLPDEEEKRIASWFASQCGGMFHEANTVSFQCKLHTGDSGPGKIRSSFEPVPESVNPGIKNKGFPPVANLGISSLKTGEGLEEKSLVKFVRFGQVSMQGIRNSGIKNKIEEKTLLDHKAIATAVLLNTPGLLKEAENGSVTVPLYRIDMCGLGECKLDDPETTPVSFEHDLNGKKVQVNVDIQHFRVPIDSKPDKENNNLILDAAQLKQTNTALESLLSKAGNIRDKTDEATRGKIDILVKTLSDYKKDVLDTLDQAGNGMDGDKHKYGPEMLRFGSQVAMLTSLLGDTPAINCNWGRDRTSAMDNEIKLLSVLLERGVGADRLSVRNGNNDERKWRTDFLHLSGNAEIATHMSHYTGPINLNQGSKNDGINRVSMSGFNSCFKFDVDNEKTVKPESDVFEFE